MKENLEKTCTQLNSFSRIGSENVKETKELEKCITGYSKCLNNIASLALLSNNYNMELAFDLLDTSVNLLSLVEKCQSGRVSGDLLTVFGFFNMFDYQCLRKLPDKWPVVGINLARLKKFNEIFYDQTSLAQYINSPENLLNLIHFNFSLLNLDIQFNRTINDMFTNIGSAEDLFTCFSYLNEVFLNFSIILDNFLHIFSLKNTLIKERIALVTKFVYSINQSLCIKHKENKLIWLFDGYNPLLPFTKNYKGIYEILLISL